MKADEIIQNIYNHSKSNDRNDQIDYILRTIDDFFTSCPSDNDVRSQVISKIDPNKITSSQILALLTATLKVNTSLGSRSEPKNRESFYKKCEKVIKERHPDDWEKQLMGLK